MRVLLSVSLLVIVGLIGATSAAPIVVNNPSFESPVLTCAAGPLCFSALGDIPDWATSGRTSTFKPSTGARGEFIFGIPDGVNVAAIGDRNGGGSIFQALPLTVQANTNYVLRVFVGASADILPFSQYTVALEAGGTVLFSDNSNLHPGPGSFFEDSNVPFSTGPTPATLGQQLGIRLSATGPTDEGFAAQAVFDDVTFSAIPITNIPEPGTLFLLTTSCIGLLGYRCVRRRYAVSREIVLGWK
jgi:hypothetical protein